MKISRPTHLCIMLVASLLLLDACSSTDSRLEEKETQQPTAAVPPSPSQPSIPQETASPTPSPTQELSSEVLELSEADAKALGDQGPGGFSPDGYGQSILGSVAKLQPVDGANNFGSAILPIFPLYTYPSNSLSAPQAATIKITADSLLIQSNGLIEYNRECDPTYASFVYNSQSQEVSYLSVRIYHAKTGSIYKVPIGTKMYTLYQSSVIKKISPETWEQVMSLAREANEQADKYKTYMKDPDALDPYGKKSEPVEYPKLKALDLTAKFVESTSYGGFSIQSVVTSPLGEGFVGSLKADFSKADLSYSEVKLLSPQASQDLVTTVSRVTGWTKPELFVPQDFPKTATEFVRALNLNVSSGMAS